MIINSMIFGSGGGGDVSINVVAYASAFPTSAPANTIGIITTTPISGYCFSNSEPTTGVEDGLVWIKTGSESPTPIPVGEGNNIFLYPIAASQYVNGAFVEIDANNVKCYQSGWKPWRKYLFNGSQPTGFTWSSSGTGASSVTDRIRLEGAARYGVNQRIDFGEYHYLCIDYSISQYNASYASAFGFNKTYDIAGTSEPNIVSRNWENGVSICKLDLSTAEETSGYIKLWFQAQNQGVIYRIWLEG